MNIPVETWNYKSQDSSIRHIGPMAQDFHAMFGFGENDKTIATVDADGVALASIQGLHQLVQEQQATIQQQDAEIAELKAKNQQMLERLEQIEAALIR